MRAGREFALFVLGASDGPRARRAASVLADPRGLAGRGRLVVVDAPGAASAAVLGLGDREIPVAAGGDGTVSLLARSLIEAGLGARVLGILPFGTGNSVAHALGVGSEGRAVSVLLHGSVRAVDCIRAAGAELSVAVSTVSVGLESRFIRGFDERRGGGRWSGLARGALAAGVVRGRVRGVLLELDGAVVLRPREAVYNAGLHIYPSYGFGVRVLPSANPADGVGEAVVRRGPFAYWAAMVAGARGALAPRRWRRALLESNEPVQVDGEPGPRGRFELRVEPRALRFLVPA